MTARRRARRFVAARGGRDAMGDEQDRARCRLALDGVEDGRLGLGVDGREGIVEHQDLGLPHQRAGQRDALLLPARELHAALADDGVEAVGQRRAPRRAPGPRRRASRIDAPALRASRCRRGRSRCCAPRWSRRGTRPAARSRWRRRTVASGRSQTSCRRGRSLPAGVGRRRARSDGEVDFARAGAAHERERAARRNPERYAIEDRRCAPPCRRTRDRAPRARRGHGPAQAWRRSPRRARRERCLRAACRRRARAIIPTTKPSAMSGQVEALDGPEKRDETARA